jgi:hypothetical protein
MPDYDGFHLIEGDEDAETEDPQNQIGLPGAADGAEVAEVDAAKERRNDAVALRG